jgi:ankyrin repeat protein
VNDWTALHGAVAGGDVNSSKLLLKYGARIDLRDRSGMTPLDMARHIQKKHPNDPASAEMVRLLEAAEQQSAP